MIELIRAGAVCLCRESLRGRRHAVEVLPRLTIAIPFALIAHPMLRHDRRATAWPARPSTAHKAAAVSACTDRPALSKVTADFTCSHAASSASALAMRKNSGSPTNLPLASTSSAASSTPKNASSSRKPGVRAGAQRWNRRDRCGPATPIATTNRPHLPALTSPPCWNLIPSGMTKVYVTLPSSAAAPLQARTRPAAAQTGPDWICRR